MVQRKVPPNKLGIIQADHIKSEKRLGTLKPASSQHQDARNRGGPIRKPPPLDAAATPQKQLVVIRSSDTSPNYMKATSSSAARKERSLSPVSSLNAQTDSDCKKVGRRDSSNSKRSSVSTNKPTKSLTKSSSFKLMRSLTKTTSFKPVRGTTKRCNRGVALCKEMTAQKSTCSSTLKDSKFPAYLMLSPGATEAEGTSIMKVCPYTYCSLNGHHHNPVLPLKCFLKARRRSLKTQKSMKLEALSPRKAKPSRVAKGKSDGGVLGFDERKTPIKDAAVVDSVPILKEVSTDFFIEIYANNIEDSTASVDKSTEEKDVEPADLDGGPGEQNNDSCFDSDSETGAEEGNIDQVAESLSDTSAESKVQDVENFQQNSYIDSEGMEIKESPIDENKVDMDVVYSTVLAEEEATSGSPDSRSEIEDYISEATDMVWEEGPHFVSETDEESYYSNKIDDDELSVNNECTIEIKRAEGIWLDDITITYIEEILVDGVLKELFEESASIDTQCNDSCEMDSMANSKDEIPFTEVAGGLTCDQFALREHIFEVPAAMEEKDKEAETDFTSTLLKSASMGVTATKAEEASDNSKIDEFGETENDMFQTSPQPGDVENDGTTDMTLEASDASQEDRCQPDDADQDPVGVSTIAQELVVVDEARDVAEAMENEKEEVVDYKVLFEVTDSSSTLSKGDEDDSWTNDDQHSMMHKTDEFQLYEIIENSSSSEDLANESGLVESQKKQGDEHHGNTNVTEKPKSFKEDQDEIHRFKVLPFSATDEHLDSKDNKTSLTVNDEEEISMEEEACSKSNTSETILMVNNEINPGLASKYLYTRSSSKQELPDAENNRRWTIGCRKPIKDELEEERDFNPKDPNFLPVIPDPEAEKVDLRHQMIDDKKNAEEWMLDYALQQAVTKLAPARKRKVALLVEAFETLLPIPKYKPHIHTSAAFSPRAIQACS